MKSFTTSITTFLERLILSVIVFTALTAFVPSMSFAIQPPATTQKVILLINQAKSTYLKPMGMDFNAALNQHPDSLAAAMGLALQRQMLYIEKNPDPAFQYSQLRRQATDFLGEVAQAHNYRHPINGTPMDKDYLEEILIENAAGFFNDAFIKKYGIDPSTVNLPLLIGDKAVQNDVQDLAAFQQKKENNDIILFGQKVKATDGPVINTPEPSPPPAPPVQRRKVVPDDIIGSWSKNPGSYEVKSHPQNITFRKGNGKILYEGRSADGSIVHITKIEFIKPYEITYKGHLRAYNKHQGYCYPDKYITFSVENYSNENNRFSFSFGGCSNITIGASYVSTGR